MSEDKEGLKGTILGAWSGGEQTAGGEENDTKCVMTGMGPFFDTPPFWTPPPLIKGRMAKGVRNCLSIVDLGALILAAQEICTQL
jgi:hypothetical protein